MTLSMVSFPLKISESGENRTKSPPITTVHKTIPAIMAASAHPFSLRTTVTSSCSLSGCFVHAMKLSMSTGIQKNMVTELGISKENYCDAKKESIYDFVELTIKLLEKVGADETISPEHDTAVRCAKKLISKDILDLFDIWDDNANNSLLRHRHVSLGLYHPLYLQNPLFYALWD